MQSEEELIEATKQELKMWEVNNIPPPHMLPRDTFHMEMQVASIMAILRDKFGVTDSELQLAFLEVQLDRLRQFRKEIIHNRITAGADGHIKMPWEK